MAGLVLEVTDNSFKSEVLEAAEPVLVDFWAPWCPPCRAQGPIVDQVAQETQGKLKVVKLNVEQNPAVANTYQIQGIPALFFFKGGQRVAVLEGLHQKQDILGAFAKLNGSNGSSAGQVVACPKCGQKNRVPANPPGQPVCGSCGSALASG